MYHISEKPLEHLTLHPRIPDNYMTQNGYEDNVTPRVCFSTDISTCILALPFKSKGMQLYVYKPKHIYNQGIYIPTSDEVPDAKLSQEIWSLNSIELQPFCMIELQDAIEPGLPYLYGDNQEAELFFYDYKIIKYLENYSRG